MDFTVLGSDSESVPLTLRSPLQNKTLLIQRCCDVDPWVTGLRTRVRRWSTLGGRQSWRPAALGHALLHSTGNSWRGLRRRRFRWVHATRSPAGLDGQPAMLESVDRWPLASVPLKTNRGQAVVSIRPLCWDVDWPSTAPSLVGHVAGNRPPKRPLAARRGMGCHCDGSLPKVFRRGKRMGETNRWDGLMAVPVGRHVPWGLRCSLVLLGGWVSAFPSQPQSASSHTPLGVAAAAPSR